MTNPIMATWNLSLNCDCPSCNEHVDLLDYCDFWDSRHFEPCENGTANTRGVEVICPECEHEFVVDLEY